MTEDLKSLYREKIIAFVKKKIDSLVVPTSIYRLQLNRYFNFRDASRVIPYLHRLGIHAVYCSPYFQASPNSMHGYNVTDPGRINAELGTQEDFENFCQELAKHKMTHIADVVPNHMGIVGNNNHWWNDVLENGQSSLYAAFFDIEWDPIKKELKDKVLIPILGDLYGHVLENQEIQLSFREGGFFIQYAEHQFPIDVSTYPYILELGIEELEKTLENSKENFQEYLSVVTAFKNLPQRRDTDPSKAIERNREKEIAKKRLFTLTQTEPTVDAFIQSRAALLNGQKGQPRSFDMLDKLLGEQVYRLAYWRVASEEINYRRFFNINELAALRIEDDRVFEEYHQLLFKLIGQGKIQGLRIDHPDGLYDPPRYFKKIQFGVLYTYLLQEFQKQLTEAEISEILREDFLRQILSELLAKEFAGALFIYLVVEKILDRRESMPENWRVHGTVGYDYLNVLNNLFIQKDNGQIWHEIYQEFAQQKIRFDDLVYEKKKFFSLVHMASEINTLGHRLDVISEKNRNYRDFTRNNLSLAIRETIACFPVYRTYIDPGRGMVSKRDEKYILAAIGKAKRRTPAVNPGVYDFLKDILLLKFDPDISEEDRKLYEDFVMRFQQLTGPIMAKGLEDTAFYVYNRFISLNEVGGDPFCFGETIEDFHRHNFQASEQWPYTLTTLSTHDTKRSSDVRMRLNVMSEIPEEWKLALKNWSQINAIHKTMLEGELEPGLNTEYFIYQTLVGTWPDEESDDASYTIFVERMWQCFLKAVREAKVYTSWAEPDEHYEKALHKFVHHILDRSTENPFLSQLIAWQKKISYFGKLNSLSAAVLQLASPGVVDVYQGTELYDYSLVDPDNRRPVDYSLRVSLLQEMRANTEAFPIKKRLAEWVSKGSDQAKLFILWRGLHIRSKHPYLFLNAEYIPLEVKGPLENHIIAFMRKRDDQFLIVIAARFLVALGNPDKGILPASGAGQETRVGLPVDFDRKESLIDIFTEENVTFANILDRLWLNTQEVLSVLPATLLMPKSKK